jgi:hypothetical protein
MLDDDPAMGFNRRKMEDQRRQVAEKEAASRRATDAHQRQKGAARMESLTRHDVRNMREDEINAPVNWRCVDCGVNTAPGRSTRAQIYKPIVVEGKEVVEQTLDTSSEVYTVRDAIWAKAGMKPFGGCLCIDCLEARLGRKLESKDFLCGHEFNDPSLPGTIRLLERRGRTKGQRLTASI